jgi:hypothetical protein
MPVMILYKNKSVSVKITDAMSLAIAKVTDELLKAKIEVRVLEPVSAYNANEIHLEMRFRDFGEWDDKQLENYHRSVMQVIGAVLKKHEIKCSYSFYILPSTPPRSIWAQAKS